MPSPSPHFFCLLATLAVANVAMPASARADNSKYRPPLGPHFTAGQTFSYNAHAEYSSLIRMVDHGTKIDDDGTQHKTDRDLANDQLHFQVQFVAKAALAREVFKNGSLREAVFQVDSCQVMDEKSGLLQTLIPRGAILGARKQKDGQITFAINGVAPDSQLAAQLSVLIVLGNEQVTNDDLLGPPAPVAVDAVWPINLSAVLNSDLPQCFPGLSSVTGSVKLVSVRTDQSGGQHAVISAAYSLDGVKPPFKPELKPEPSTVHFDVVATTPAAGGPGEYGLQLTSMVRHAAHTGNANIGFAGSDAEFNIHVDQNVHFLLASSSEAETTLAHAPTEPAVPPVPPGLSAATIYRMPVSWVKNSSPPAETKRSAPAETPANSAPVPSAVKPAPAAATNPIRLDQPDSSPFANAHDLPSQSGPPPNSK